MTLACGGVAIVLGRREARIASPGGCEINLGRASLSVAPSMTPMPMHLDRTLERTHIDQRIYGLLAGFGMFGFPGDGRTCILLSGILSRP